MCGIAGVVTAVGEKPALSGAGLRRALAALAHRGPDGEGVLDLGHALLGHRRLRVVDVSEHGAQPMRARAASGASCTLIYNGELYNDAEVRQELGADAPAPHLRSDTATIAHALAAWGEPACGRFRGMYAYACLRSERDAEPPRELLLARDPLGVKPLFWARCVVGGVPHVVFASEVSCAALLVRELTGMTPPPDVQGIGSYLAMIRTNLFGRTLLQGVHALQPGERLRLDLASRDLPVRRSGAWDRPRADVLDLTPPEARVLVKDAVRDSVQRHLRSDVPVCALLSGGLDSSIIAHEARRALGAPLPTFCAGAALDGAGAASPDFAFAREMAAALGSVHTEAPITRELFLSHWGAMVRALGTPLSTPNETAIFEVCSRLRASGCVVALSGEGADELFAGYDLAIDAAAAFEDGRAASVQPGAGKLPTDPGVFNLEQASWIPPSLLRGQVLSAEASAHFDEAVLFAEASREFALLAAQRRDDHPLQAHLRWQRRVNLAGLLGRLDTSAMLAGVEGRTPFADAALADLAESLPLRVKFAARGGPEPRTKLVLRDAFSDALPRSILMRPKASFPLPFEGWLAGAVDLSRDADVLHQILSPDVLALAQLPSAPWRIAWPVLNVAMFVGRWYGTLPAARAA